jgi:hypothetical protein
MMSVNIDDGKTVYEWHTADFQRQRERLRKTEA